jgi:hypothetical protein
MAAAQAPAPRPHALTSREREELAELGYLLRLRCFDEGELARIRACCERMVRRLVEASGDAPKIPAGSYLFQPVPELCSFLKWEPEHPDVVQGVEPFAHFDDDLRRFGNDPRFVEPMKGLLGAPEVELFTEKLNLKRPRVGGSIVLHQDYPYWTENSEDAGAIATAVLFLDDADRSNGGLEVLPGSHKRGLQTGRTVRGFGKFEMETQGFDETQLVALDAPAGSVVFFGSLLVHRSMLNASDRERRTLLYSYQPAGRRPAVAFLEAFFRR